ncbi:MAG: hypothetical protein IJH78_03555 [Clostridia bacterium]|nr:hypothetical protein [Clostridia bacterium]
MEDRIRSLFDYQKYEKNEALQAIVDAVHARYTPRALSDEEVELIAAAGIQGTGDKRNAPWEKDDEQS